MNASIVAVTFEVDVQAKSPQFSIPQEVCRFLGVNSGDDLRLVIRDLAGNEIFNDQKSLRSGKEIYGADIRQAGIVPGQRICVEARRK
jgi:hypothetical protein